MNGMGSILEKLFKAKSSDIVILAPMDGERIDFGSTENLSFLQKHLEDGFIIRPTEGTIIAPISGVITEASGVLRAVRMETDIGIQLSIVPGLNETALEPSELETFVEDGQRVEAGDVIMKMNLKEIEENRKSAVTILFLSDWGDFSPQRISEENDILEIGTPFLRLKEQEKTTG